MTYAERIEVIADACENLNIPHEVVDICDGKQIRFPWTYGDIAIVGLMALNMTR